MMSEQKTYSIVRQVHQLRNELLLLGFIGLGRNHITNRFIERMNLLKTWSTFKIFDSRKDK